MGKAATSGRPPSFSRDDAVQRAMQLFWRDGYNAVTTRDLARAMNIQRSSFYNSFGSKDAVFAEALDRYVKSAPDAVLDEVGADRPVVQAIVDMFRELCRVRAADKAGRGCLACNSITELVAGGGDIGRLLDRALRRRLANVQALLQRAVDGGEIEMRASVADTARALVAFLIGINGMSKSIRDEGELWAACRTFLAGIGVPDSYL